MTVVVVGAGISGLAAARWLLGRGVPTRVIEASDRVGGLIHTERVNGLLIEHGPDALLVSRPALASCLEELALAPSLVEPRHDRALIRVDGALHPLPTGLLGMGPAAAWSMVRSPLFGAGAKARFLAEPLMPRGPGTDESVASFFGRRCGAAVVERLVDPLLGGLYGAPASQLGMAAVMPHLLARERAHGSLARGLVARSGAPPRPRLRSLTGGLGALPAAMARGTPVTTGARVTRIERRRRGYLVHGSFGILSADAVIVAVPAWHAAPLLERVDAELADELGAIEASRLDAVTLAWPRDAVPHRLDATGFVSARAQDRLRACTWISSKWPGRAPAGTVLLRAFLRDAADDDDDALVEVARGSLREALGITAPPTFARVTRRARALPRYVVGHRARVERVEQIAGRWAGLALTGNAYRGVGIADCVDAGERAAREVATRLGRAMAEREVRTT